MNELTLKNVNGHYGIDSREVAEMTGIRHSDLLEKIGGYEKHLLNGKFRSADFFIPSIYEDSTGRTLPCYILTRKGCDMVANKMTGEKGVLFTATYVTKFDEMEQKINSVKEKSYKTISETKQKEIEARYNNSLVRRANILLKIASNQEVNPRYKQILESQASAIVAGMPLLPLPEVEEKTYSAGEIGKQLGISANMVGRLAKEYDLKTDQYGKLYHDKSPYSSKEVEAFRYYENVIPKIKEAYVTMSKTKEN